MGHDTSSINDQETNMSQLLAIVELASTLEGLTSCKPAPGFIVSCWWQHKLKKPQAPLYPQTPKAEFKWKPAWKAERSVQLAKKSLREVLVGFPKGGGKASVCLFSTGRPGASFCPNPENPSRGNLQPGHENGSGARPEFA